MNINIEKYILIAYVFIVLGLGLGLGMQGQLPECPGKPFTFLSTIAVAVSVGFPAVFGYMAGKNDAKARV